MGLLKPLPAVTELRQVPVGQIRWNIAQRGTGPNVLLLHGTGGAIMSWRGLMPILAERYTVIAPDLPGHGASRRGPRARMGLAPMAEDLCRLLRHEGIVPAAIVGHSAGAALMLQLALMLQRKPAHLIGINAALANFPGMAGWLFPMLAKGLALNPLTAPAVARLSSRAGTRRILQSTGSEPDAEGLAEYTALLRNPRHVEGALLMMAEWSLDSLRAALPGIDIPTLFIAGDRDRAVPAATSDEVAARMPQARVAHLPGLGHLAHEEAPETVARLILDALRDTQ